MGLTQSSLQSSAAGGLIWTLLLLLASVSEQGEQVGPKAELLILLASDRVPLFQTWTCVNEDTAVW